MVASRTDVLFVGPKSPLIVDGLSQAFALHMLDDATDKDDFIDSLSEQIGAIAVSSTLSKVDAGLMQRLPKLQIVSSFGVGYDHIDVRWAAAHGIVVTNTPEVLNEEVADTAIALLLSTVYGLPQAERHLRDGAEPSASRLFGNSTLRNRTVGMVGMGRIGQVIARRLEAFDVAIAYHSRNPNPDVNYKYYPKIVDLAHDVDTLLVIVPGGPTTKNLINAEVLEALGPDGILINMARGSVVDEQALVEALNSKRILTAGLDTYIDEPHVNPELVAMDHVVLLPHVGSASVHTRSAMDRLVVDNLLAWGDGRPPLTPVPETRWG